ncbi:MAG: peptidoglycan-binding protein, partial [Chromatiaceae bacterium]
APAAPLPRFPDEDIMIESERRQVQGALKRIGYYTGEIDGLFGPETRAAIRRFQYEIGAEMTGTITGQQAARLLAQPQ